MNGEGGRGEEEEEEEGIYCDRMEEEEEEERLYLLSKRTRQLQTSENARGDCKLIR